MWGKTAFLLTLVLVVPQFRAHGENVILHGKVVMEDGAKPGRPIMVLRYCDGLQFPTAQTMAAAKTGVYYLQLFLNAFGEAYSTASDFGACHLEASLSGYSSSRVDLTDRNSIKGFEIADIVLARAEPGLRPFENASAPGSVARPWGAAVKLMNARSWAQAETLLRNIVTTAPTFTAAWMALGNVYLNDRNPEQARHAFEKAIELGPNRLVAYSMLLEAEIGSGAWEDAVKTSKTLIAADARHVYLEAYIQNALALYELKDYDGAAARINEAIRLDKRMEFPRSEFILGLVLEARSDLDGAGGHLRHYLAEHPKARDAEFVADRLANLGKQPPADLVPIVKADMRLSATADAPVPGGLRAFSTVALLPGTPGYGDFFLQYCRAIAEGIRGSSPTLEARDYILQFVSVVSELDGLAEHSGGRAVVRLALDTEEHRQKTARVMALFGWRLARDGEQWRIDPGDQRADGVRQRFPSLFGIDELDMWSALFAKRHYQFEIPVETARLFGGAAWSMLLKSIPSPAGGPVELFIRDPRLARTYAGLASMDPDTAATIVSTLGLATLITRYSQSLADYGEILRSRDGRVEASGGPETDKLWSAVAGEDPKNAPHFLRALLEKDQGRLLSFYFDVSRADGAHRRFLLASSARLESFYAWYRDSGPIAPPDSPGRWQTTLLQKLPLDASGAVRIPGGPGAWPGRTVGGPDALPMPLRSLAAMVELESKRGARLDPGAAQLLVEHFEEWRHLIPYFEKLPGLAAPELQSLAAFTAATAGAMPQQQAILLGEFHSLVEMIILASQAGSLDAERAAAEFRRVADGLRPDTSPADVLAVLREMAGGSADLDEAVPRGLLRLGGSRRASFDRVKELQNVPRLASLGESPEPGRLVAALSGLVYAALLDPGYQLVADDANLLAKHNFLPASPGKTPQLFADSGLISSDTTPGSYLVGGFGRFLEVTRQLDRRAGNSGPAPEPACASDAAGTAQAMAPGGPSDSAPHVEADFRASGRLVEVYATVTDNRGRYIDDLKAGDFTILEEGQKRPPFAFEDRNDGVTVALLFDTTGSMQPTLPSLKAAALRLIYDLRPDDTVAVYGFNDRVNQLQAFTADKTAARRAVLKAHPLGATALYDALVRVSDDLAWHPGKKVILVFTDGDDNSSLLTAETAIVKAKTRGIPIYTIASGEAIDRPALVKELDEMSRATGGTPFLIRRLDDIAAVFQKVSDDLKHGYLLAFQPSPGEDRAWRRIELLVRTNGVKVRAREGYYPE